jgi:hypothetical protein
MKRSALTRFQDWLDEWNDGKTRQLLVVVLGILCGILAGMLVYAIAKYVLDQMFPFPPGLYMVHGAEKAELMKTVLIQLFIVIPLTWAVGTLAGGYCAARMSRLGQFPAWITGILLIAYYWIDLLSLPNDTALFVLCPVVVGLCAWGGGWLGMYVVARKSLRAEA